MTDLAPFDPERDAHLGAPGAAVTMIAYGDYADPFSRPLRDVLRRVADRLAGRAVFVYRHRPAPGDGDAERAARAAVAARRQGRFWDVHAALYERGRGFSEAELRDLATEQGLDAARFMADLDAPETAARVEEDRRSAEAAGVEHTPALFIDGRRYEGAWDETSIQEAVERPLGLRLRGARERFFAWAASSGLVLVLATLAALAVVNLGGHDAYERLREAPLGLTFGAAAFALPLEVWINDGLMALFFLIVGVEIKREVVSGELSSPRDAALPVIGALGGMAVPAGIYAAINWGGPTAQGWGVPMATDIAFTLGLMALLGRRVPAALKVFVSALAIADDLGAILVIALFYAEGFDAGAALGAGAVLLAMLVLNRGRVYALAPYLILGVVLWACVFASGLHATLAGVLTAVLIPSRPKANPEGVAAQTVAVLHAETRGQGGVGDRALAVLGEALGRLREPGTHLQHRLEGWTNYLVLPLFAFFNTGIPIVGSSFSPAAPESLGVMAGLVLGKPLGIVAACWLAVRFGVARLSSEIAWPQMIGAGCLAGVGFTMSIFIATAAFEGEQLEAVKLAVLLGSTAAALLGMAVLHRAGAATRPGEGEG